MKAIVIFLSAMVLLAPAARAFEVEGFAGANSTSYDKVSDANTYGVSLRTKLNFYGTTNHGFFVSINARGESLLAADTLTGYAFRSSGTWFVEAGAGYSLSAIFGSGAGFLLGTGAWLNKRVFVNFPIMYGTTGVFWSPYIGIAF